ncbi:MAG: hypothetical protein JKY94_02245 [Rhodobacteraceae bacterium]|nr:hypothetical protein [Paracoccaceae bacterium]
MIPLLDTHQHLVLPDVCAYPLIDNKPELAEQAFTNENYAALTKGVAVAGRIFMETGADDADYQREARHVAALAKAPNSGLLGVIASCRPETDRGFSAWLEEGDRIGFLGYRRLLHKVDDGLSRSDIFRKNINRIGARAKPFDLCLFERQLPIATELAEGQDDSMGFR